MWIGDGRGIARPIRGRETVMKLDFFIMGTEKGGSTYLLDCLREHPGIFMPRQELAFFENSFYDPDDTSEFTRHFSDAGSSMKLGVKRPSMLGHPEFGERLHRHFPESKLIGILRHPIERALSAYTHHRTINTIPNRSAEWFFNRILEGPIENYPRSSVVLEDGLYERHLRRLERFFPRDRILLLTLDEIREDDIGALRKVFRFLGVEEDFRPSSVKRQPMRAPYSPILAGYRRLQSLTLQSMTEDGFMIRRKSPLLRPVHVACAAGYRFLEAVLPRGSKPELSPELRKRLFDFYEEDIAGLERRLGRELDAWRR